MTWSPEIETRAKQVLEETKSALVGLVVSLEKEREALVARKTDLLDERVRERESWMGRLDKAGKAEAELLDGAADGERWARLLASAPAAVGSLLGRLRRDSAAAATVAADLNQGNAALFDQGRQYFALMTRLVAQPDGQEMMYERGAGLIEVGDGHLYEGRC